MKIQFDLKSLVLGAIFGWYWTVSRASITVAREYTKQKNKEQGLL